MTSGFDGAIYTWDINQYQESQAEFKKGEISALFFPSESYFVFLSVLHQRPNEDEVDS